MNGVQHKIVGVSFGVATAIMLSDKNNASSIDILIPIASCIGSLIPDIDHDRTKIGRKRNMVTTTISNATTALLFAIIFVCGAGVIYITYQTAAYGYNSMRLTVALVCTLAVAIVRRAVKNSKTFKWATAHRGLMHTLIPLVPLAILMNSFKSPSLHTFMFGIIVGYISHLFADMLTVRGAPVLFPIIRSNIRILKLSTTKGGSCTVAAFIVACITIFGSIVIKYFL